jgi:7-cyano-7-deazaguanine synthase
LCLALAIREFKTENVLSLSFRYGQRHSSELAQADKICAHWNVDHLTLNIDCLQQITSSALTDAGKSIEHTPNIDANTLVVGRNGLMARLAAIHAENLGAHCIYMGIIEADAKDMGYRDCTREYMDLEEQVLRLDLNNPSFEIRTPLVHMSKLETLKLSDQLGILDYLLQETISCYEGIPRRGCEKCPTCKVRNHAIDQFIASHSEYGHHRICCLPCYQT